MWYLSDLLSWFVVSLWLTMTALQRLGTFEAENLRCSKCHFTLRNTIYPALIPGTHHLNPQYHIRLTKRDEDDTSRCTCLVELTQKDRRIHKLRGRVNVDIGFVIYSVSLLHTAPLYRVKIMTDSL
jgi:4'-phosphopantetheinyl transferase EntD